MRIQKIGKNSLLNLKIKPNFPSLTKGKFWPVAFAKFCILYFLIWNSLVTISDMILYCRNNFDENGNFIFFGGKNNFIHSTGKYLILQDILHLTINNIFFISYSSGRLQFQFAGFNRKKMFDKNNSHTFDFNARDIGKLTNIRSVVVLTGKSERLFSLEKYGPIT